MNRVVLVVLMSIILTGCSNNPARNSVVLHNNVSNIGMLPVKFGDRAIVSDAVMRECGIEKLMNNSIKLSASEIGFSIDVVDNESELKKYSNTIDVNIVSVEANEWRFPFWFRPSSIMNFTVEIYKDGNFIKRARKSIRSSASFTACERLNKVAETAGIFVVEWSARSIK